MEFGHFPERREGREKLLSRYYSQSRFIAGGICSWHTPGIGRRKKGRTRTVRNGVSEGGDNLSSSFKRDNVGDFVNFERSQPISADFADVFNQKGSRRYQGVVVAKGVLTLLGDFDFAVIWIHRTSNFISQTETHHPVCILGPPNVYVPCRQHPAMVIWSNILAKGHLHTTRKCPPDGWPFSRITSIQAQIKTDPHQN